MYKLNIFKKDLDLFYYKVIKNIMASTRHGVHLKNNRW